MDIQVCVNYKDLDWIIHITNFDYISEEPSTYWCPGSPAEIEITGGWVELDGELDDIINPTTSDIVLLNLEVDDNKSLFEEILEEKYGHIEEVCLEWMYEEKYNHY